MMTDRPTLDALSRAAAMLLICEAKAAGYREKRPGKRQSIASENLVFIIENWLVNHMEGKEQCYPGRKSMNADSAI